MMIQSCSDFTYEQIDTAFRFWLETEDTLPTIAGIKSLMPPVRPNNQMLKYFSDFNGDWNQYKEYLAENSALSSNFELRQGIWRLPFGYYPEKFKA